jgi:hypothetical protein
MRTTKSPVVGVLLGLSLFAACRSSSNNGTPDGPGPGSDTGPAAIHIQDVQSDTMVPNTPVELHGVIVVAVDTFGAKTGDMWIEEPGGGERSGVHVFNAPVAQVASLKPGDIIDLTGAVKSEFALSSDTSGRTVTELQPPKGGAITVTKTGTGTVPDPHVIDVVALGMMTGAQRDAVYEKWEGVLIKVQNVGALAAPVGFGAMPYPDDAFKFEVSGKLVVESTQSKFPPSVIDGTTCVGSITGVEDYFFDWLIMPRTASDLVLGGTGCPLPAAVTVAAVQTGTGVGSVLLRDVFVTAVTAKTIWVADSLQGAANNGVAVFYNAAVLDPGIVVGAMVSVVGTTSEFDVGTPKVGDTLTEITNPTFIAIAAPTASPTPLAITAAQVSDIVTGEPFEGVFVQGSHFKVTAIGQRNQVTLTDNAGGTIVMDDDIFANYGGTVAAPTLPAVGDCYLTLTGVMSVQLTDNLRTINPRSAVDMVIGTASDCN